MYINYTSNNGTLSIVRYIQSVLYCVRIDGKEMFIKKKIRKTLNAF